MASPFRVSPSKAFSPIGAKATAIPSPAEKQRLVFAGSGRARMLRRSRAGVSGRDSYLEMWRNARERERKATEFEKISGKKVTADVDGVTGGGGDVSLDVERKSEEFEKILQVPKEERDRC